MNFLRLAKKNNAVKQLYEAVVIEKIRKKYSINQELAILRQRDTKPDEFAAYNEYVEQCKRDAKAEMEG